MQFTVQQIADALSAECRGDSGLTIVRAAEPSDAGPTDLAMAMSPKYAEALSGGAVRLTGALGARAGSGAAFLERF